MTRIDTLLMETGLLHDFCGIFSMRGEKYYFRMEGSTWDEIEPTWGEIETSIQTNIPARGGYPSSRLGMGVGHKVGARLGAGEQGKIGGRQSGGQIWEWWSGGPDLGQREQGARLGAGEQGQIGARGTGGQTGGLGEKQRARLGVGGRGSGTDWGQRRVRATFEGRGWGSGDQIGGGGAGGRLGTGGGEASLGGSGVELYSMTWNNINESPKWNSSLLDILFLLALRTKMPSLSLLWFLCDNFSSF